MKINIYTALNGVGLEKDYLILKSIAESAGHKVECVNWLSRAQIPKIADIALHLEIPRFDLMRHAVKNVLIPNSEWFNIDWLRHLKKFDEIWAKTYDCESIFNKRHSRVVYTSFTSIDFYDETIIKKLQSIHIQGKSQTKGTHELLTAYVYYNDLPQLILLSKVLDTVSGNVLMAGFLPNEQFKSLLNACMVHICPSYYEGFGHYIWEAMSCGNVVLTTDTAPMNEFITDSRFLLKPLSRFTKDLATGARPDYKDIRAKLEAVYNMPMDELIVIGKINRQRFLDNDKLFKSKVNDLLTI